MTHYTGESAFAEIVGRVDMSGAELGVVHRPCGTAMVLDREADGTYAAVCPVCHPAADSEADLRQ